jgi:hypothetical protein
LAANAAKNFLYSSSVIIGLVLPVCLPWNDLARFRGREDWDSGSVPLLDGTGE